MFNLRAPPAADRCVRLVKDRHLDRDKQRWTERQPDIWIDMQTDRQTDGKQANLLASPALTAAIGPLFLLILFFFY